MALRVQEPSSSSQMPAMLDLSQYMAHRIPECKCLSWLPDPKQGWSACCHRTTQHNLYCSWKDSVPSVHNPPTTFCYSP